MSEQEEFEFRLRLEREGKPEKQKLPPLMQGLVNLGAGGIRGAGSIGATLLSPVDVVKDLLAGKGLSLESNRARRQDMDAALAGLTGAETDSTGYQLGKIGGEVAGTLGVGPVMGAGAAAANLPRVGQALAAGGMGSNLALPARMAAGAAVGGASAGLVNPEEAGTGAMFGGALPAVGSALSATVGKAPRSLMQSAIKPTIKQLKTGDADIAIDTLLKYGISPNQKGVEALRNLLDDKNAEIANLIAGSNATVNKFGAVRPLSDTASQFSKQVNPTADLNAISNVGLDFLNHPVYQGTQIPVQAAQELKQGTYKILAKKYGQVGTAETEAQKAIARGLKDEIAGAVPGIQALNAEESRLIKTLDVAERRALMELNKNPAGLSLLAGNKAAFMAFLADRSAAFKALAARMINRTNQGAGLLAPYAVPAGAAGGAGLLGNDYAGTD